MLLFAVACYALVAVVNAQAGLKNLKSVAEWGSLDYVFPSSSVRQAALSSGQFVPGNGVPIDVDVDYKLNQQSRIFVTVPRFTTGIPVTFGYVASGPGNLIQPYPDYSWHSSHGTNCDGITSVFRVAVNFSIASWRWVCRYSVFLFRFFTI